VKSLELTYDAVEHVLGAPPSKLERLSGGRNNRLIRASHPRLGSVVIKDYFREGPDSIDRLTREWNYLIHLKNSHILNVPQPLFKDTENRYAIYSDLKGEKLSSISITIKHIEAAAQHIVSLSKTSIGVIDPAKGMQSNLSGHIDDVHWRMDRLREVANSSDKYYPLQSFLKNCLEPLWAKRQAEVEKSNSNKYFETIDYKLSPSDFGFHNILSNQNKLSFIDFEYAGKDDLAKLTTDFMLAPAVPITANQSKIFCNCLMRNAELDSYFLNRVKILLPIAEVKWICIILNDFIEPEENRKDFAVGSEKSDRLKKQLVLASQRYSLSIRRKIQI